MSGIELLYFKYKMSMGCQVNSVGKFVLLTSPWYQNINKSCLPKSALPCSHSVITAHCFSYVNPHQTCRHLLRRLYYLSVYILYQKFVTSLSSTKLLFGWVLLKANNDAQQVGHPILMTECECNPSFSRVRMSELLFETYGVPSIGNNLCDFDVMSCI